MHWIAIPPSSTFLCASAKVAGLWLYTEMLSHFHFHLEFTNIVSLSVPVSLELPEPHWNLWLLLAGHQDRATAGYLASAGTCATPVFRSKLGGGRNGQAIYGLLLFDPFLHLFVPPTPPLLYTYFFLRGCPLLVGGHICGCLEAQKVSLSFRRHSITFWPYESRLFWGVFWILGLWIFHTLVIGISAPLHLF